MSDIVPLTLPSVLVGVIVNVPPEFCTVIEIEVESVPPELVAVIV